METDHGAKKTTKVVEDNEIPNRKATPPKRKASEISEGVKSDNAKSNKGNSYPAKRTRSSGPVTWDCPFCEDKKYEDNLEYLVHLQKAHKCNLPGQAKSLEGKAKR